MVPSFDEYAEIMRAQGYEQWLTWRGETRHLVRGEGFELDVEDAHAERYGEEGATYWVGRREVKRG